jgi:predicted Zn finger-like uncharacterized protein
MIEIQCTSCHTRYRIDERVLPDETPTFKCSRCGHVFSAQAVPPRARREKTKAAAPQPEPPPPEPPAPEPFVPEPEPEAPEPEPEPPRAAAPEPPQPSFRAAAGPIEESAGAEREAAKDRGATAPAPAAEQFLAKLHRDFARGDEPGHTGENLKFDFNDEAATPPDDGDVSVSMPPPDDDWQVGDTPSRLDEPIARLITRPGKRRGRVAQAPQFSAPPAQQPLMSERHFRPEAAGYFESQGSEHSSAAFIGLFFLVAIGFGALSLVLCGAPQASVRMLATMPVLHRHFQMPVLPATMVALSDVHTSYRKIKGGRAALVITGTARNVGLHPLHAIQISVDLLDGQQRELAGQSTWCGNTLAAAMIGEMTPHELEFLERLEPQAGFVLDRAKESGFELIFVDPPAGVANLRIAVTRADPAASAPAPRT